MERRDLYDAERNLTNKTILKGEKIPEGKYIVVVVVLVFIQNYEGKFLIQKRSKPKNGKYATTGGHPKSGESSIQGILTEVKEEIGLELDPKKLQLYFSGRSDEERVFWDDYYINMEIDDLSKLKLQKDEVESIKWFSEKEILELNQKGMFFKNHFEEFENLMEWLNNKEK